MKRTFQQDPPPSQPSAQDAHSAFMQQFFRYQQWEEDVPFDAEPVEPRTTHPIPRPRPRR
ncbi:MAG: hypothetical protein JWM10_750 [Myxococcaceae bacterium]|nr:hypothetical protein [Myxococcaceae bacterium]